MDSSCVNPTYAEMRDSVLNIMVVGTADGIVMIESGAKEVKEETVVDAIEFGHAEIKKIVAAINELRAKAGKSKRTVTPPEFDQTYYDRSEETNRQRSHRRVSTPKSTPRPKATPSSRTLKKQLLEAEIPEEDEEALAKLKTLLRRLCASASSASRSRKTSAVPMAARSTRSAPSGSRSACCPAPTDRRIFTRGETQALVTTTLGTSDDMQRLEIFEGEAKKRFMLHYNFPPFSVGEVRFPSRRWAP